MRINHNLMAMNTARQLGISGENGSKSIEKLSSGLRINRAGDDAAGLAISEKMRGQIRGLNQGSRNAQDGISMIQTAEGGLNETHSILQRMRELSVQASNDTLQSTDRTAIGEEMNALRSEVDRISSVTEFNGKKILDGTLIGKDGTGDVVVGGTVNNTTVTTLEVSSAKAQTYTFSSSDTSLTLTGTDGKAQTITVAAAAAAGDVVNLDFDSLGVKVSLTATAAATATNIAAGVNASTILVTGTGSASFQIGANANQTMSVAFTDMSSSNLGGVTGTTDIATLVADNTAVSTTAKAQVLITQLDAAIVDVSSQRAKFGAAQNRLEHTIKNLDTSSENMQASESRIRDVDMAKEMMEFTKNNILQQAGQSMLAQANQAPQGVLQLLR
ncbi:flagellin N-terminal helical domain-containing protein [Helicovermis profundi]|uniref:Flagellin n=1 Tax=Helicovermis profundi TaxID=3065157 RepID=A0AAU9EUS9_9FIRM|nr:flagellin [Clostridia bacterium S502]